MGYTPLSSFPSVTQHQLPEPQVPDNGPSAFWVPLPLSCRCLYLHKNLNGKCVALGALATVEILGSARKWWRYEQLGRRPEGRM